MSVLQNLKNANSEYLTDIESGEEESGEEGEACHCLNALPPRKSQTVLDYITNAIRSKKETSSFIVTNLTKVKAQYALWMRELPFVEPMYA